MPLQAKFYPLPGVGNKFMVISNISHCRDLSSPGPGSRADADRGNCGSRFSADTHNPNPYLKGDRGNFSRLMGGRRLAMKASEGLTSLFQSLFNRTIIHENPAPKAEAAPPMAPPPWPGARTTWNPPPEGLEIARALGGRVAEIAKKLKG